jgi:hypothetical protein
MSRRHTMLWLGKWVLPVGIVCTTVFAQQPAAPAAGQPRPAPKWATPTPPIPLFFKEEWRQVTPLDESSGFDTERPLTPAAVTSPDREVTVYDAGVNDIPALFKAPPPGGIPRDYSGANCVQLAGYNQHPRPEKVLHGDPTDPPNLWTGACKKPVVVTLRDKNNFVDLTGLAKMRWVTRVSGFHEVRPVLKLADGTFLVGDHADGRAATNSMQFLETEFPIAPIRWLRLDMARGIVTRGMWVDKPDLTRVDEIGFADLMPSSGHGWGGFVNVAKIEVYGKPVKR